jgi:BirA family biotin operon repressor/biotin-[acetyl-CoA-carboxylase] ligase
MASRHGLLTILADGRFHSGTELGERLGCSRSAVWKTIHAVREADIEIFSVRGKGYRLAQAVELLHPDSIRAAMHPQARPWLEHLDVQFELDSTNARLLEKARQGKMTGHACLAERQTLGRGRRGRDWVSPFGGNLYCSLLWRFGSGAAELGGLSLAVAVAVARALAEAGMAELSLKWPNDILCQGRKLAGILLEVAGEAAGPCHVVIGVGINIRMPAVAADEIAQPWVDMESLLGKAVARNRLAGGLLSQLIAAVREFETTGMAAFVEEWRSLDACAGREVVVQLAAGGVRGIAQGIDADGALLVAHDGALRRYHSGEVSLRVAHGRGDDAVIG